MGSTYSGRAGGNKETPSPDRSHTRRSLTPALLVPHRPPQPPQPQHSLKKNRTAAGNTPQMPRRPRRARPVPRNVGPVERRAATEHAAVLVRRPAAMPQDVQRDQPEHSLPLETGRATSSTAGQEDFALTRRHDTAERAHHAGARRPVVGPAAPARHALELQEARQVRKELHSPEQQHANMHRLFIKLCWLMNKHAVS